MEDVDAVDLGRLDEGDSGGEAGVEDGVKEVVALALGEALGVIEARGQGRGRVQAYGGRDDRASEGAAASLVCPDEQGAAGPSVEALGVARAFRGGKQRALASGGARRGAATLGGLSGDGRGRGSCHGFDEGSCVGLSGWVWGRTG